MQNVKHMREYDFYYHFQIIKIKFSKIAKICFKITFSLIFYCRKYRLYTIESIQSDNFFFIFLDRETLSFLVCWKDTNRLYFFACRKDRKYDFLCHASYYESNVIFQRNFLVKKISQFFVNTVFRKLMVYVTNILLDHLQWWIIANFLDFV